MPSLAVIRQRQSIIFGEQYRTVDYYLPEFLNHSESYQIHKGIGGNVNAIALLKCFGYPEEITTMATEYMG